MAHDEADAARIRQILAERNDVSERKMMGGIAFMVGGTMCCAASGHGGILVRIAAETRDAVLAEPHVAPMDMGARTMRGFVRVAPAGYGSDAGLRRWVRRGIAAALVRKAPTKRRTRD